MKQKKLSTCLYWCWLLVCAWLLPSMAFAQSGVTQVTRGEAVTKGLSVVNSIVWDNVFENSELFANNYNLVNEDPLFVSETDYLPDTGSPALGKGLRTKNDLEYDIAGLFYAGMAKINIGAYQSGASYTVTINAPAAGGTLQVYNGAEAIVSLADLPSGTELKVMVVVESGYSLKALTANGAPISNGASFFLTAPVTFEADIIKGSIRGEKYATYATGSFKSFNNIIYDNIDDYGNYALNKTQVVNSPLFNADADFALQPTSPALDKGDTQMLIDAGLTLPVADIAGSEITEPGVIASGAYQQIRYKLSWITPTGGTLKVYYLLKNDAGQSVKTEAENGTYYPGGTIHVEAVANAGYVLDKVSYGETTITITDGKGSFTLTGDTEVTATFRSVTDAGVRATVFETASGALALLNNIVYQNIPMTAGKLFGENLPVAANLAGDAAEKNLLDTDPKFKGETNFVIADNSPAIDQGKEYAAFDADSKAVAGEARLQGGAVDMGAYESGVEAGYAVTFSWSTFKDARNKDYAEVIVMAQVGDADPVAVASGDILPLGTVITVAPKVYDTHADQYVVLGQIKVGDDYLAEGVYSFVLEKDSRITHNIQTRKYPVHYSATAGTIRLYNGNTLVADSEEIAYGTILSVMFIADEGNTLRFVSVDGVQIKGAEEAGGYMVTVQGEVTIIASGMEEAQVATHGLIVWDDIVNATVTATTTDGDPVNSGDALPLGTVVNVTVAPTSDDYGFLLFQLNGEDQSLARTSFSVAIEAGTTTFIAVRCGVDGEPAKETQTNPEDMYFPGDVTFTDDMVFDGDAEFGGDATFEGDVEFNGEENHFAGNTEFKGEANFTNPDGETVFEGDVTFEKGADFAAEPEFQGDVTITGEINLPDDGSLTIGEGQTLTVEGEATVKGDMTLNGGTLELGELTVDGSLTLNETTIKATEGSSLKADAIINDGSGKSTIDIVQSLQQGSNSPLITIEFAPGNAPTKAEMEDLFDVTVAGSDREGVTYEWHQYGDTWILEATAEEAIEIINGDPVYDGDVVFDEEVIFAGNPTFNGDATFNDEAQFQGDVIFGGENTTFATEPEFQGDVTIGGNITLPDGGSLTVGDGQTLTLGEEGASVTGNVTIDSGKLILGDLEVTGDVTLDGGATLVVSPGATIDAGSITGSTSPKSVIDLSQMPMGENSGLTVGKLADGIKPGDLFEISTGGGANYSWKDNGDGSYTLTVTRTEPATPDPDAPVYVTLTIPDTLPEGITMNPGPGEYQVLEGASKLLKLLIDEKYEDSYVFLRINGDYVMVKSPVGELEFSYLLVDIREALKIEVIISTTANPEEGTVGNATLTPGIRVTGESGKLTVESDRATKVLVYTVGGKLVANSAVNGTREFYLPAGIYIVQTTISTPVKVVVR